MSVNYLVLGTHSWHARMFTERTKQWPGSWHYLCTPRSVTPEFIRTVNPRYLFAWHWSWKIPSEVLQATECIGFHMTKLPEGRGGSPLQHLLLAGRTATDLTAFRLTEEWDAGPIYGRLPLTLEGSAESIYIRATELCADLTQWILTTEPDAIEPTVKGEPPVKRRTPPESELPVGKDLNELETFIRMLDAEGYPKAFLSERGYRFEFSRVAQYEGKLRADVEIARQEPLCRTVR